MKSKFASGDWYLGLAIVLFSTDHWIGGLISLSLVALIIKTEWPWDEPSERFDNLREEP